MPDQNSMGGLSPEAMQQMMAMLSAMLSSQKKPDDPVADYLAELQRQDEERKKQEARRAQTNSLLVPPNVQRSGSQGQSGFGTLMSALGNANSVSNAYNGESLWSNLGSLFSAV